MTFIKIHSYVLDTDIQTINTETTLRDYALVTTRDGVGYARLAEIVPLLTWLR